MPAWTPGRLPWLRRAPRLARVWAIAGVVALAWSIPASRAADAPGVPELMKALDLGSYMPDMKPPAFSARTPDGHTVSLAGLRGRVALLTFWATWCPPCKEEMPVFERFHREFGPRGLTVLGINVREGASAVQAYGKELGLTFPLVLDPDGKIQAQYGVIGLPTTFLVGRDGRPVARAIGPRAWGSAEARALLEALLAEPAPGKQAR